MPTPVDWNAVLPAQCHATVLFSILDDPVTPRPFDVSLSAIKLPGEWYIDVEWKAVQGELVVTLFLGAMQNWRRRIALKSTREAVVMVHSYALQASRTLEIESISTSEASTTSYATVGAPPKAVALV